MRAFTGFPDEQKCELYNIMEDFFRPRLSAKSRVGRPSEVATASRWPQQPLRERSWTEAPAPASSANWIHTIPNR